MFFFYPTKARWKINKIFLNVPSSTLLCHVLGYVSHKKKTKIISLYFRTIRADTDLYSSAFIVRNICRDPLIVFL